jgi:hypothetical protein
MPYITFNQNTAWTKLEEQLEDGLVQIHPNSSDRRIQAIVSRTAEIASGQLQLADEKIIIAWKRLYHLRHSLHNSTPHKYCHGFDFT